MDLLQTHNFALGRSLIKFVIPRHGKDYLDLTHHEPSHTRRKRTQESGAAPDVATRAGSINHLLHSMFNQIDWNISINRSNRSKYFNHFHFQSFTAFHVQSNRLKYFNQSIKSIEIFQSKIRVTTKQSLRLPHVYRGVIKLYASPTKISHLTSYLWDADIPGYMDDTLNSPNTALERRGQYIRGNRALDLIKYLHVFNQDKFLINRN